jgi:hypothetical protein
MFASWVTVKRDRRGSAMQVPTYNAQKQTRSDKIIKLTRYGENVEYLGLADARLVHKENLGETRSLLAKA